MKKIFAAVVSVAALCSASAFAADLPTKAPAYAAAPVPSWNGFYVGGSVGARWSDVTWTTLDFDGLIDPIAEFNSPHLDNTGVRVGGYVGFNWMVAPATLVGLEADIAWGDNKKTKDGFPGASPGLVTDPAKDFVTAKLGWDGSLRGRIGFLANPNWLIYATGGVAWQQIETTSSCLGTGSSFCDGTFSGSSSETKAGWTAGGGVEGMLAANWVGRIEYRYADFGHVAHTHPPSPTFGFHANVEVNTHTALAGLAYKF